MRAPAAHGGCRAEAVRVARDPVGHVAAERAPHGADAAAVDVGSGGGGLGGGREAVRVERLLVPEHGVEDAGEAARQGDVQGMGEAARGMGEAFVGGVQVEPVDFRESLVLKSTGKELGARLALFYMAK